MSVEERKREEGIRKQTGDTMKLTFETLHAETLYLRLCSLYCVNSCTPARSARVAWPTQSGSNLLLPTVTNMT